MKLKPFIFGLCIIIMLLAGCSTQSSQESSIATLENFEHVDNISNKFDFSVIDINFIDKETECLFGFVSPSGILAYDISQDIFKLIDLKTGIKETILKLSEGQRAVNFKYDNHSIVWVEDGETETNNIIGKNWGIYEYNMLTKEITIIEKESEETTPSDRAYCATPNEFSFKDGYIAYVANQDYNNGFYSLLKLHSLKTKETLIIDSIQLSLEEINAIWFSVPSVNSKYVAYSISHADLDTVKEFGKLYLYDIQKKEKSLLKIDSNVLKPVLNQNRIACRMKPDGENENSEIYIYDIDKNEWTAKITNSNSLYKGYIAKPFELIGLESDGNYLVWYESHHNALGLFDFNTLEVKPIVTRDMNKEVTKTMFNSKMLLWEEHDFITREYKGFKAIILE
ncbi:hypothetical protein [Petroclostridium sp. X23]|uniref:hypothetical protein n=1 Tax=Petroclostridium sp. X23 TaxID=3045146 RepID=UPI0024AD7BFA|nr:hypothetical protein [Petroclostridium sp. X23]WHH56923.1 hypothetical protein QKW49_13800 [Petroclostridium sp. X23]